RAPPASADHHPVQTIPDPPCPPPPPLPIGPPRRRAAPLGAKPEPRGSPRLGYPDRDDSTWPFSHRPRWPPPSAARLVSTGAAGRAQARVGYETHQDPW